MNKLNKVLDEDAFAVHVIEYKQKMNNVYDQPLPWIDFSIPQLSFLKITQQHCRHANGKITDILHMHYSNEIPEYMRVKSMLWNSFAFKIAFECPIGTERNANVALPLLDFH